MSKYIVIVSIDDCSSESGNLNYCDFLAFDSKDEALAAARAAFPHGYTEEEAGNVVNFTDKYDNWLMVVPSGEKITLMNDPADYEEEEDEDDN